MADVDAKYRLDMTEAGGYKRYCGKLMNRLALDESGPLIAATEAELAPGFNSRQQRWPCGEPSPTIPLFSVTLQFSGLVGSLRFPVNSWKSGGLMMSGAYRTGRCLLDGEAK